MSQFARPNSDISNTNWSPSTGTTLYGCIDETTASDTDYIRGTSSSAVCEIGLSSVDDPQSSSNHTLRLRAKANGTGAGEKWTVQLKQGSTIISTPLNAANISRSWTDLSFTLTSGEADSITDYSALSVYMTPTTAGASESVDVSWMELEVPDPPAPATNVVLNIITNM